MDLILQICITCVSKFSDNFLFAIVNVCFLRDAVVYQGTSKGEIHRIFMSISIATD